MDWGDLALAGLTVLLVFLSAALTIGIDLARRQLERKQRRADRRDDFQHDDTLVGLQDAVYKLVRATGAATHEDEMAFRRTGTWGANLISEEWNQKSGEATILINTLAVRVDDDQTRNLVSGVVATTTKAVLAQSKEEAMSARGESMDTHQRLNNRIEDVIRSL